MRHSSSSHLHRKNHSSPRISASALHCPRFLLAAQAHWSTRLPPGSATWTWRETGRQDKVHDLTWYYFIGYSKKRKTIDRFTFKKCVEGFFFWGGGGVHVHVCSQVCYVFFVTIPRFSEKKWIFCVYAMFQLWLCFSSYAHTLFLVLSFSHSVLYVFTYLLSAMCFLILKECYDGLPWSVDS